MSGNLLASSLLASPAPLNRDLPVHPSDARGHGAGFENLLAEFDQSNASASVTNGEKTLVPQVARVAAADPSALTTSHATLRTNLDAALSSLAMSVSAASGPTSAGARTPVLAATKPSATPARQTTTGTALSAATNASGTTTPNLEAAAPSAVVAKPQTSKRETITPAVAITPSGAVANPVASDVGSFVAVAIAHAGAAKPTASSPPKAQSDRGSPSAASAVMATPRTSPNPSLPSAVAPLPSSAPAAVVCSSAASATAVAVAPRSSPNAPVWPATAQSQSGATVPPAAQVVGNGAASPSAVVVGPPTSAVATVAPAIAAWPSGSEAKPSAPDAASLLFAAISQTAASTNGASVASSLASGGSGVQPAFASSSLSPAPGAAVGTIAHATQIALSFAPELGFQGLQTTTHLAVRSAESGRGPSPASASPSTLEPANPASERSAFGVASGVAAEATTVALSAAPELGQTKPRPAVSSTNAAGAGGRVSNGVDTPAFGVAAPSVAPRGQVGSRNVQSTSQSSSGDDPGAPRPDAPQATATSIATASQSPAAPSSPNSIDPSALGERLASEARSLAQPEAESNGKLATAPIKELKLDLHPESLGAVAIKLKLTDGKLSVAVGVDNPDALAAVEGQRDSIVSKLQAGAAPLENFVVHQQTFGEPFSAQNSSQPSLTESSGNPSGHEHTSRNDREQTPRQQGAAPSDDAPSLGNRLDAGLVV